MNQELEQTEEDCRALRQKCTELEEQLADTIKEKEQIKEVLTFVTSSKSTITMFSVSDTVCRSISETVQHVCSLYKKIWSNK